MYLCTCFEFPTFHCLMVTLPTCLLLETLHAPPPSLHLRTAYAKHIRPMQSILAFRKQTESVLASTQSASSACSHSCLRHYHDYLSHERAGTSEVFGARMHCCTRFKMASIGRFLLFVARPTLLAGCSRSDWPGSVPAHSARSGRRPPPATRQFPAPTARPVAASSPPRAQKSLRRTLG
ncbi:hypothetical protein BCR34DRAFT_637854 [Clohesyomyces aquaticus]|uniref:Uncharacterized protein n=1 Tax=Clohesyomyces aquaticus TaxID=1231657 RepID=A0A1Y2A1P1_9PLEO|nr:hypothetical protein BCR34DRAFT_637854 [Clohesyomyces aquaticus]